MTTIEKSGLKIDKVLYHFLVDEALPGSGVDEADFFKGLAGLVADYAPRNHALLETRDALQAKLDAYHREHRSKPIDQAHYMNFLREIGYLAPQPAPQAITTANVDAEIAEIAGPQLVVPISNARYALNAANARWGSLYDALYGTDAIGEDRGAEKSGAYNPVRGARVVAEAKADARPDRRRWPRARTPASASLQASRTGKLVRHLDRGRRDDMLASMSTGLTATQGTPSPTRASSSFSATTACTLEIVIDRSHPIGRTDPAGVADVIVESAISSDHGHGGFGRPRSMPPTRSSATATGSA